MSAIQRFWMNVRRGVGCWEWAAGTTKFGYGKLRVGGRHAQAQTAGDNNRDKAQKGRARNQYVERARCSNGHGYTPANTRISKSNGQRVCRACELARTRKRRKP